MKALCLGDVVGRTGREALKKYLPRIQHKIDFLLVNGENAAAGFGITPKICKEFYDLGIHVITTGNHIWRQKEILSHINQDPYLIRPANYPEDAPGRGVSEVLLPNQKKVIVINIMGQTFMPPLNCPFETITKILKYYSLASPSISAIIVDMHAEATSEKMGMGHYLDGKVSLVFGTHTHTPTSDHRILSKGTAYQTDLGMCGDYDSVIGMNKDIAVRRFLHKTGMERYEPAQGEGTMCGCLVEIDDITGLAKTIEAVRIGPHLEEVSPGISAPQP